MLVVWGDRFAYPLRQFMGLIPRTQSVQDLETENAALRAELENYSSLKEAVLHFTPDLLTAVLYSAYPWNAKHSIVIGAGSDEGVGVGMAVEENGVLLGVVVQSFAHTSEVRTVFDKNFEMPVKIGADRVDGLLKGGTVPEVTLIAKAKQVVRGDSVYSASAEVPFGMPLGMIGKTTSMEGEIWESALLDLTYDFANIPAVQVITNFSHGSI
jgi:cell shape-determining protein MreC